MMPAKPALWAESAPSSGAANNKPPFEMGVGNFGKIFRGVRDDDTDRDRDQFRDDADAG